MNQWSKIQYAQALQKLIEDVDPRFDKPGHWSTFLRETVGEEIERIEHQMAAMRGLHMAQQQEAFNLLAGEIKGLKRLLKDDFGIGAALAVQIEKQT
jgi:hypothetical protein